MNEPPHVLGCDVVFKYCQNVILISRMKLLGVCGKFWNGKGRGMEFLNVFFLNIGYRSINFNFSHNKIVRHCIWKILEMEEECPSMIGVDYRRRVGRLKKLKFRCTTSRYNYIRK